MKLKEDLKKEFSMMYSMFILIIIGFIRTSESLENEKVCESDNGVLKMSGDLVILGSEAAINNEPKTVFVKYTGENESFCRLN